eukprot:CAMPEP_0185708422 /NCGR_PEP_ID=MMETSP1164-20130828/26531_1 /TAXON_ID=1104430 /ORGANISM="Chrysoreinhardia sp, Strain CCMP2950" /LENGTH=332 /DNA_ID=CAMNT_0028375879 /DNA_START=492 /DNA_END=1489 /DNA_ORIENTATION=+
MWRRTRPHRRGSGGGGGEPDEVASFDRSIERDGAIRENTTLPKQTAGDDDRLGDRGHWRRRRPGDDDDDDHAARGGDRPLGVLVLLAGRAATGVVDGSSSRRGATVTGATKRGVRGGVCRACPSTQPPIDDDDDDDAAASRGFGSSARAGRAARRECTTSVAAPDAAPTLLASAAASSMVAMNASCRRLTARESIASTRARAQRFVLRCARGGGSPGRRRRAGVSGGSASGHAVIPAWCAMGVPCERNDPSLRRRVERKLGDSWGHPSPPQTGAVSARVTAVDEACSRRATLTDSQTPVDFEVVEGPDPTDDVLLRWKVGLSARGQNQTENR